MFFKDGKIDCLLTNDKQQCLAYDLKTKLENLEVRKKLQEIVKDRMRECEMFGKELSKLQKGQQGQGQVKLK